MSNQSKSALAINGGEPVILQEAPHFRWPIMTEATEQAVIRQMRESISIYNRSGIFERFEKSWSSYHGVEHSLLTSSGTAAILSMFVGVGIEPGDEVICPAYTFHATASPLFILGARPVLCDCDGSGNLNPANLDNLLSPRTRAVIVTHMWGVPCDMEAIRQFCDENGLYLLEDCAHAHGALIGGKPVGSFGDAAAWSIQGPKLVTGGEGGVMSTSDREIYTRANLLGHYNKRCVDEIQPEHPLYDYRVTGMGLKLRAHPFAVAMAEEQFSHLPEWLEQKREYARQMNEAFAPMPGLAVPVVSGEAEPSWYAYVLQYRASELGGLPVSRFVEALHAEGALEVDRPGSTGPLNNLPLYQAPGKLFPQFQDDSVSYAAGEFPRAQQFFDNAIKLPVWAQPDDRSMVESYIAAFQKVVENYRDLL